MTLSEKKEKPVEDKCPRSCEIEMTDRETPLGTCWGTICKNIKTNTFRCHCSLYQIGTACAQMNRGFKRRTYSEDVCN